MRASTRALNKLPNHRICQLCSSLTQRPSSPYCQPCSQVRLNNLYAAFKAAQVVSKKLLAVHECISYACRWGIKQAEPALIFFPLKYPNQRLVFFPDHVENVWNGSDLIYLPLSYLADKFIPKLGRHLERAEADQGVPLIPETPEVARSFTNRGGCEVDYAKARAIAAMRRQRCGHAQGGNHEPECEEYES